jgi:uncharacterized small protein (DUF1192 family)
MTKRDTDRIAALEAEVAKLRDQVDKILAERQAALEARGRDYERMIGLR